MLNLLHCLLNNVLTEGFVSDAKSLTLWFDADFIQSSILYGVHINPFPAALHSIFISIHCILPEA